MIELQTSHVISDAFDPSVFLTILGIDSETPHSFWAPIYTPDSTVSRSELVES